MEKEKHYFLLIEKELRIQITKRKQLKIKNCRQINKLSI